MLDLTCIGGFGGNAGDARENEARSDGTKIRVISARDMHRKERRFYDQGT